MPVKTSDVCTTESALSAEPFAEARGAAATAVAAISASFSPQNGQKLPSNAFPHFLQTVFPSCRVPQ